MNRAWLEQALPHFPGRVDALPTLSLQRRPPVDGRLVDAACDFLREDADAAARIALPNLVVGLSGGLDSTVAAVLARRSLGRDRVRAVVVDLGVDGHAAQTAQALEAASRIDVAAVRIDAAPLLAAFEALPTGEGPFSGINRVTRVIHDAVFGVADAWDARVVSTLDLSEALVARHMEHFYGHVAPLAGLYKTEVARMARLLGVPEEVLTRSPGCVEAWLDHEVLGATYDRLDPILDALRTGDLSPRALVEEHGVPVGWVERLVERMTLHPGSRMSTRAFDPAVIA